MGAIQRGKSPYLMLVMGGGWWWLALRDGNDMIIELGEFGIFRRAGETTPEIAQEVERLGFGALWLGGSPGGDLETIEMLLEATDSIPIATGIVNMWRDDASIVADSYHRVSERHPGRFLLGVGIGHPEATSEYRRPLAMILEYLGQLDAAGVPSENLVLAALGPKVLAAAAEHTRGAHPYLTTPRHTRFARRVIGDSPLLAPEQTVVVCSDQEQAREIGRAMVSRYLKLVNYRNNLLREGWTEADVGDGGSDQLVDELVLAGTPQEIVEHSRRHLSAGADHVSIQTLGSDPVDGYRALAEVLFSSNPR
jgi:probable F420-dependent oxidoreductase